MKIKCKWCKGAWTEEENNKLRMAVAEFGSSWTSVSEAVGSRSPDQCAKHWTNTLDPDISHGGWTDQDDRVLRDAVHLHGRAWKKISARYFPTRSTLEVANRYNLKASKSKHDEPAQSCFDNRGTVFSLEGVDDAMGTVAEGSVIASMPCADDIAAMGWHDPTVSFPIVAETGFLHPYPTAWDANVYQGYGSADYLGYAGSLSSPEWPEEGMAEMSETTATSSSAHSVIYSDGSSPILGTDSEWSQNYVQKTSLTMENLDSDTRNEILEILCRRRISTTIGVS